MTATALSTLRDIIWPYAGDAPAPAVDNALRRATTELCKQAKVWRTTSQTDAVAGQTLYTLAVPTDAEIHQIRSVRWNNESAALKSTTEDILTQHHPDWPLWVSKPKWFVPMAPLSVGLVPAPAMALAAAISARLILKPTRTATTLESTLFDKYEEGLIAGAAMYLNEPHLPWANASAYQLNMSKWGVFLLASQTHADGEDQYQDQTMAYGGY